MRKYILNYNEILFENIKIKSFPKPEILSKCRFLLNSGKLRDSKDYFKIRYKDMKYEFLNEREPELKNIRKKQGINDPQCFLMKFLNLNEFYNREFNLAFQYLKNIKKIHINEDDEKFDDNSSIFSEAQTNISETPFSQLQCPSYNLYPVQYPKLYNINHNNYSVNNNNLYNHCLSTVANLYHKENFNSGMSTIYYCNNIFYIYQYNFLTNNSELTPIPNHAHNIYLNKGLPQKNINNTINYFLNYHKNNKHELEKITKNINLQLRNLTNPVTIGKNNITVISYIPCPWNENIIWLITKTKQTNVLHHKIIPYNHLYKSIIVNQDTQDWFNLYDVHVLYKKLYPSQYLFNDFIKNNTPEKYKDILKEFIKKCLKKSNYRVR